MSGSVIPMWAKGQNGENVEESKRVIQCRQQT